MEFRAVDPAVPPASDLVAEMVAALEVIYADVDGTGFPVTTPEQFRPAAGGVFLVGFEDEAALCGGGVRRLAGDLAEIKRMYVVEAARGRGLARALLVALENAARELGYARVRLDTGPRQPHAEALYRSAGYRDIADYNGNPYAAYWAEKSLE